MFLDNFFLFFYFIVLMIIKNIVSSKLNYHFILNISLHIISSSFQQKLHHLQPTSFPPPDEMNNHNYFHLNFMHTFILYVSLYYFFSFSPEAAY